MLVTLTPQFRTQSDLGQGTGIVPILQWQLAPTSLKSQELATELSDIDPEISSIFGRLHFIFHRSELTDLSSTDLHDLTCFVIHKLLLLAPLSPRFSKQSALSECLRLAMVLYMLIIHGTTYYSHDDLSHAILVQLDRSLANLMQSDYVQGSLGLWVLSVGMAASPNESRLQDLARQASTFASTLNLCTWGDIMGHLESVLWVKTHRADSVRHMWEAILKDGANAVPK